MSSATTEKSREYDDSAIARMPASGTMAVYYYFGDGFRDMFVALGMILGSFVSVGYSFALGFQTTLSGVVTVGLKVIIVIITYAATSTKNGKMMIFVSILSGIAACVSVYFSFNAFTVFSNIEFAAPGCFFFIQSIVDVIVYLHITYFAFVLL
ncbi:hypothetical protein Q1695_008330 [Nippostrongylus brasiliensis]|nr:hypothetical protein Q1695_008330 [Nippostrongylus brasiliensis]